MSEDPEERTRIYLTKIAEYLREADTSENADVQSLAEYARRYVADAKYFLEMGKPATALASIAYAEGLLDSPRILGLVTKNKSN